MLKGSKWLFTGREEELEVMMAKLKDAILQEGTLILLSGEAGIGKTRIAEEFEQKASKIDCTILIGRCIPGIPSPFLPFIEAFSDYFQPTKDAIAPYGEEALFGKMGAPGDSTWTMDRMLFSTLEFIRRKCALKPLIIRIEDLQWADSASIQLLHFLARNANKLKLLIVGTYRPEDLAPNEAGEPHPLVDALRIMRREDVCIEIPVKELSTSETQLLVERILGGGLEPSIMERLIDESEGNPLYAIETIKLLIMTDSIHFSSGRWLPGKNVIVTIPPTVKEVILRRLERLGKGQRRAIDVASAIGNEFEVETLLGVLGAGRMELFEDLEALEKEGRLIYQSSKGFRFSHEVIRQVSYESISELRRAEMHLSIGEELERKDASISPAILALHFRLGNDKTKAIRYSLAAGESFVAKGGAFEAVPLLGYVIAETEALIEHWPELINAYDSLGFAYLLLGRLETANDMLEKAISMVGLENASVKTLYNMAECWAGTAMGKGKQEKSWFYLDLAEKAANGNSYEIGRIAAYRATSYLWDGDFFKAESNFKVAIDSMLKANDKESATRYMAYYADTLLTEGKVEEAMEEIHNSLSLTRRIPGFYGELEATFYAGTIYIHVGNIKDGIEFLNRSVEIATQIGEFSAICHGYTNLCLAWEMGGDLDMALASARKSHEYAMSTDSPLIKMNGVSALLHIILKKGVTEDAIKLYEQAINLQKEFNWGMHSTTRCLLAAVIAEYFAARGEWSECVEQFNRSFELMSGTPSGLLLMALARTWFAKHMLARGMREEALEQIDHAENVFLILHNSHQLNELSRIREDIIKHLI